MVVGQVLAVCAVVVLSDGVRFCIASRRSLNATFHALADRLRHILAGDTLARRLLYYGCLGALWTQ